MKMYSEDLFKSTIKNYIEFEPSEEFLENSKQSWLLNKSSNPILNELFKDSTTITIPFVTDEIEVNNVLNDACDVGYEFRNKFMNLVRKELEEKPLISSYQTNHYIFNDTANSFLKNDFLLSFFKAEKVNFKLNLNSINPFFLRYDYQKEVKENEYIYFIEGDVFSFKPQKDELFYRFIGRIVKKMDKYVPGLLEIYHDLLAELSKYKKLPNKDHFLTLSIDPSDFITASNGNNWSTCFSPGGENAVSMLTTMTGKDSIIAYITQNDNPVPGCEKIWRTFVLLNNDAAFPIHGYPFSSEEINNKIIKTIGELISVSYIKPTGEEIKEKNSNIYYYVNRINYLDAGPHSSGFGNNTYIKEEIFNDINPNSSLDIEFSFEEDGYFLDGKSVLDYTDYTSFSTSLFSSDARETICNSCDRYVDEDDIRYDEVEDEYICHACLEYRENEAEEAASEYEI